MISVAGIYAMSAAEYQADPVKRGPSLSASIAKELITHSAYHAFWKHPRLNPAYEPEHEERFDLGSATHAYMLEGDAAFSFVEAPDWRGKLAREARDDARQRGKIPLLVNQWAEIKLMVRAANDQLDRFEDPPRPFSSGRAEEVLVWQEGDVWCRARLDWLHDDHRTIDDLKTVGNSANPEVFSRTLFGSGYDIQAAFYLRGLKAVMGTEGAFRFVVVENFAPYALSVVSLDPSAMELANRKVNYALTLWRECLKSGRWPGYPSVTCHAEPPPWEQARWMAQEMNLPMPGDSRHLDEQMIKSTSRMFGAL